MYNIVKQLAFLVSYLSLSANKQEFSSKSYKQKRTITTDVCVSS